MEIRTCTVLNDDMLAYHKTSQRDVHNVVYTVNLKLSAVHEFLRVFSTKIEAEK